MHSSVHICSAARAHLKTADDTHLSQPSVTDFEALSSTGLYWKSLLPIGLALYSLFAQSPQDASFQDYCFPSKEDNPEMNE